MTLARIIFNNARQRQLSTWLTSLSVAVGVALIIAILTIKWVSQERLRVGYSGFDLVVGAKGSALQLVLNTVYNLDSSPGNIPYSLYERLEKDPRIKLVVPFAVGDNYQGYRIVGATDTYLKKFEPRRDEHFELAAGRIFHFDEAELREAMKEAQNRAKETNDGHEHHEGVREAVVGSEVALQTGLKLGDAFVATHGVQQNEDGEKHEHDPWTVVGILKPSGTPADRALYINLDSFYHIEGHVIEEKHHEEKEEAKDNDPEIGQISSLALQTHGAYAVLGLMKEINNRDDAQAAIPAAEIRKLLTIVGNVDRILMAQAVLIIIVSGLGTGLAMFNSMNDRRRDIAVMRALGARRGTIFAIIVGEAVLISGFGTFLGFLLGHAVIFLAAPAVQAAVGFSIPPWTVHWFEPFVFAGTLLVGICSGVGPAISAYRTDVATGLSPNA